MAKKKSQFVKKPVLNEILSRELANSINKDKVAAAWIEKLSEIFEIKLEDGKLAPKNYMDKFQTIMDLGGYFAFRGIVIDDVLIKNHRINMGAGSWNIFAIINMVTNQPELDFMTFTEAVLLTEAALFVWAKKVDFAKLLSDNNSYEIDTDEKIEACGIILEYGDFATFCRKMKINPREIPNFTGVPYLLNAANIKKKMARMRDKQL